MSSRPPTKVTYKPPGDKWGRTDTYNATAMSGAVSEIHLVPNPTGKVHSNDKLPYTNAKLIVSWDGATKTKKYDAEWDKFWADPNGPACKGAHVSTRNSTAHNRAFTMHEDGKKFGVVLFDSQVDDVGLYKALTTVVAELQTTGDKDLDSAPLRPQLIHGRLL